MANSTLVRFLGGVAAFAALAASSTMQQAVKDICVSILNLLFSLHIHHFPVDNVSFWLASGTRQHGSVLHNCCWRSSALKDSGRAWLRPKETDRDEGGADCHRNIGGRSIPLSNRGSARGHWGLRRPPLDLRSGGGDDAIHQ